MEFIEQNREAMLYRAVTMPRQAIDEQARTVELSFSSEEPADMGPYIGVEILGHEKSEVNMERLEQGTHPLLLQHDPRQHIGVIEKAWIDDTKRGRAKVRFAPPTNKLAEEVFQDVLAGVRSLISVGYTVEDRVPIEDEAKERLKLSAKLKSKDMFRATSWTPMEISIVSVPMDFKQVGIGKEQKIDQTRQEPPKPPLEPKPEPEEKAELPKAKPLPNPVLEKEIIMTTEEKLITPTEKEKERMVLEEKQAREKAQGEARQREEKLLFIRKQEDDRVKEIYALGARWNQEATAQKATAEGWPVDKFRAWVMENMGSSGITITQPSGETMSSGRSIGQMFVDSPQYSATRGQIGRGETIKIEVPRERFFNRAALSETGYTLSGATQDLPGVPGMLGVQELNVSQVFASGTTSANTVRFLRETSYTNAAATALETGTYANQSLPMEEVDSAVYKVAAYVQTTDEMLQDYDGIRSFIDSRLAYSVGLAEDNLLLNGTGTAQITGILQTTGINTVDRGTFDSVADTIGQALGAVQENGHITCDAIILHPNNWTNLILSKDDNKQYMAGGPFTGAYGNGAYSNVGRLFGLPVVTTTQIAKGTGLVGNFRLGAQIFRKSGIMVEASNAEASYFINGYVAVRAQARMTLAAYKPLAFCSITSIA